MRLDHLKREYGAQLELRWKSFPVVLAAQPRRIFDAPAAASWARARANGQAEGTTFAEPAAGVALPVSSLPALEAAKCAALQGVSAFTQYHLALWKAYFTQVQDISRADVLLDLARAVHLEVDRFTLDFANGCMRHVVLTEYLEGQTSAVASVPTVILSDQRGGIRIVGEVPLAQYRRYIAWLLAT